MREFPTGATRDDEGLKHDYRGFLSPFVLQRFGQYMTEHRVQSDGTLRASDNWKKGIPRDQYLSSLLRHTVDLWRLHEMQEGSLKMVEDLLCAIIFNSSGYLHEFLLGRDAGVPTPAPLSYKAWTEKRGSCIVSESKYETYLRGFGPATK